MPELALLLQFAAAQAAEKFLGQMDSGQALFAAAQAAEKSPGLPL